MKSERLRTLGFMRRCRSAASTSASHITLFGDSDAKAAVKLVLPVPPLPLSMTNSFILLFSIIVPKFANKAFDLMDKINEFRPPLREYIDD